MPDFLSQIPRKHEHIFFDIAKVINDMTISYFWKEGNWKTPPEVLLLPEELYQVLVEQMTTKPELWNKTPGPGWLEHWRKFDKLYLVVTKDRFAVGLPSDFPDIEVNKSPGVHIRSYTSYPFPDLK